MRIKILALVCVAIMGYKKSSSQIDINQSLKKYKISNSDSNLYILTSPAQFEKSYEVVIDSIHYFVTMSQDNLIKFIETSDSNFRTADGLSVGTKYSVISQNKITSKLYDFKGWGKCLKLSSGWYAAFDFKKPLSPESTIKFFYKR